MEDPLGISEPYISIFVSYFEYVSGHNFTYVMSKGKKKMEIYSSDIRGRVLHEGGSLNGWKLSTVIMTRRSIISIVPDVTHNLKATRNAENLPYVTFLLDAGYTYMYRISRTVRMGRCFQATCQTGHTWKEQFLHRRTLISTLEDTNFYTGGH
jgi:hypothetical protein